MRGYDPRLLSKSPIIRKGSWAQVVNIGEKISHPLGALAGLLGAPRHGLEPEKGLFSQKGLCMVFISG